MSQLAAITFYDDGIMIAGQTASERIGKPPVQKRLCLQSQIGKILRLVEKLRIF
jgi:hypothetical protein